MPQPIAKFEQPEAVVRSHERAISREVGEIRNAVAEAVLLTLANMARRFVTLEIAELSSEAELLFIGQRLVAKDEHGVFCHALVNGADVRRRERFGATDARDLAYEGVREGADDDGHLRLLLVPGPPLMVVWKPLCRAVSCGSEASARGRVIPLSSDRTYPITCCEWICKCIHSVLARLPT